MALTNSQLARSSRNRALFVVLTLQAFGMLERVIELYGTKAHFYRCLLLGDWVAFNSEGQLYVTDCEVWEAKWVNGDWVHN